MLTFIGIWVPRVVVGIKEGLSERRQGMRRSVVTQQDLHEGQNGKLHCTTYFVSNQRPAHLSCWRIETSYRALKPPLHVEREKRVL